MTQKPDPSRAKSVASVGVQMNRSGSADDLDQASSLHLVKPKSVAIAETLEDTGGSDGTEKRGAWLPSWHLLGVLLILFSGGVGFLATSVLLSFNGSNNCSALYLPLASATTRLYCAQIETEDQTLESYLRAIRMVNAFSKDHPLRADIDRNIEAWIADIIALAEVKFQDGKLPEAIAMLKQIPDKAGFGDVISRQIASWESLWQEGETMMARLKKELKSGDVSQATRTAVQLSYLENRYWSTVKYDEAMSQVQLAQKENRQLDTARSVYRRGGLNNWLQALDQAGKISEESYAYAPAQKLIDDVRNKIIGYAGDLARERRWQDLLSLGDRLPARLNLDGMIIDWRILAQAGLTAQKGTMDDLEAALLQLQSIQSSSSVYKISQELVGRWQKETDDVALLEQSKVLAEGNSVSAYEQAIAKLGQIPSGNPRYAEAQQLIRQFRGKVELVEDSPVLQYAKDLAASNRLDRLAEAIAEAKTIKPGRALYSEAQKNIQKWQAAIERAEDQPIFDQAVALAQQKQWSQAINVASQINSSRAIYPEMQSKVSVWRDELAAINKLNAAYRVGANNSVAGWVEAIQLTQQIPSRSTEVRAEGAQAANRWSFSILSVAQNQANYSLPQAIATAKQIPSGTAAYESAQSQIETWRRLNTPTEPSNDFNNNFNNN